LPIVMTLASRGKKKKRATELLSCHLFVPLAKEKKKEAVPENFLDVRALWGKRRLEKKKRKKKKKRIHNEECYFFDWGGKKGG